MGGGAVFKGSGPATSWHHRRPGADCIIVTWCGTTQGDPPPSLCQLQRSLLRVAIIRGVLNSKPQHLLVSFMFYFVHSCGSVSFSFYTHALKHVDCKTTLLLPQSRGWLRHISAAFICEWVESDVDPNRDVDLNILCDIGFSKKTSKKAKKKRQLRYALYLSAILVTSVTSTTSINIT